MNKQEQIEEMEKIIDELYNVYDTTAGDIAEGLYNAGYRKGETYNYTATINHSYLDRINQLENRLVEVRNETAKEILQEWVDDNSSMGLDNTFVKNIAKKYGVEVEE